MLFEQRADVIVPPRFGRIRSAIMWSVISLFVGGYFLGQSSGVIFDLGNFAGFSHHGDSRDILYGNQPPRELAIAEKYGTFCTITGQRGIFPAGTSHDGNSRDC